MDRLRADESEGRGKNLGNTFQSVPRDPCFLGQVLSDGGDADVLVHRARLILLGSAGYHLGEGNYSGAGVEVPMRALGV